MSDERDHLSIPALEISYYDAVDAVYQGLLGRHADESGRQHYLAELKAGLSLSAMISDISHSTEFTSRNNLAQIVPPDLPDLTRLHPEKYLVQDGMTLFDGSNIEDFNLLESYIVRFRYYDSFGVWSPTIDLDKRVTAGIVKGLGAKSCIELGCFTGPVLSVLAEHGIDVCGVDVSHLAFVLAYPNIRDKLRFGDLLDVDFGSERFDALIAMDVVEHLNPLKLPLYLAKIVQLVDSTGFVFINSPMIGTDDVFGTPFPPYVTGWTEAGDDSPWLRMHCDEKGWPLNGHLIWASPKWWEAQFERSGLVRSRRIERCIHSLLQSFFEQNAPARKSFFALTRRDFSPDEEAICARLRNELAPLLP